MATRKKDVVLPEDASVIEANAGAHEEQINAAIENISALEQEFNFDLDTLIGDARDHMLELYKRRPKPWTEHSSGEQRDIAAGIEQVIRAMAVDIITVLAQEGRPAIRAKLEGYSDKAGEIKGTLKFLEVKDEQILELHKASGKIVLMVTADSSTYDRPTEAAIMPDQNDMFESGPLDDPQRHPEDNSDLALEDGAERAEDEVVPIESAENQDDD